MTAGDRTYNGVVTQLGKSGPIIQQRALIDAVRGLPGLIEISDVNFTSNGDQYRLTKAVLDDAWLAKWPEGIDDQGTQVAERIDYIFLSTGTAAKDAHYPASRQSDRRAFMGEISR